jgi:hypothetical protein
MFSGAAIGQWLSSERIAMGFSYGNSYSVAQYAATQVTFSRGLPACSSEARRPCAAGLPAGKYTRDRTA